MAFEYIAVAINAHQINTQLIQKKINLIGERRKSFSANIYFDNHFFFSCIFNMLISSTNNKWVKWHGKKEKKIEIVFFLIFERSMLNDFYPKRKKNMAPTICKGLSIIHMWAFFSMCGDICARAHQNAAKSHRPQKLSLRRNPKIVCKHTHTNKNRIVCESHRAVNDALYSPVFFFGYLRNACNMNANLQTEEDSESLTTPPPHFQQLYQKILSGTTSS